MHEAGAEAGGQKIKSCPPHSLNCRGGAGISLGVCVGRHTGVDSKWYISQLKETVSNNNNARLKIFFLPFESHQLKPILLASKC